ncbi:MAG: cytochrome c4 [Burkholderiales bacterium]|nr:cytochrome c4 [Burkholderiales bacterium]
MLAVAVRPALAAAPAQIPDTIEQRLKTCTVCHGAHGRAGNDGYYPSIGGKPGAYLYHQLVNFRDGRRHYPTMVYLTSNLTDAYLHEIADYFAAQNLAIERTEAPTVGPEVLARGEQLVRNGDPGRKVPACVACHDSSLGGVLPATPGLVGLPHDYLFAQLANWRSGARKALPPDCMAEITKRLAPDDLRAVAVWLSLQHASPDARPAAKLEQVPPMECGSTTP